MSEPVILRPRRDGPFYELRPAAGGGFRCVPYYSEPDGGRVMTPSEAAEYAATVRRMPDSLVIGDPRTLLPRLMRDSQEETT
ncbi:MAG: hypothetical protein BWY52_03350 [Chloroflexi bacterium ADurb.Bin325]|jgi:hypothetical protein|nr:MAG: hypothetical protein BWY52_03350 [Chloroflexi bacterium ADurb.Bin325]